MSEENSQNKEAQFISKRQYSRVSLFDPIRLITSEYTFEEYMGNISKTGCMILGIKELEIGHNAEVAIKCPEKGYVNFKGTVRRCQEKNLDDLEAENKEIKDILLVDDDPEVLDTLCDGLESSFSVVKYSNTKDAKEALKQFNFRTVLTDARMPGEDGASLLSYVSKEQPECKRLLITGQADNDLMLRAVNQGQVEQVIYKPISLNELEAIIKEMIDQGSAFEMARNTRQRYYNCYSCHYSAYRVDMVDGVKWETQTKNEEEKGLHYFYDKKFIKENKCPKCLEKSFMSITSKVFEIGLEFSGLTKELDETLDLIISDAVSIGSSSDQRKEGRVAGDFIPVKMEKRYGTGAELFDAYISDISRGGVRLESGEDYTVGQKVNLDLGITDSETTQIPATIMHKTKVKTGFSYGLKFQYFDVEEQAKLNHFIDELALGSYQEREEKSKRKQMAVGIGGAGFSGFLGGLAAAFILFGGFYFLSGYQFSKKERILTVTEGGKQYKLNMAKVFKGKTKGLPKKLISRINKAKKKCKKAGKISASCFEKEIQAFVSKVTVPKIPLEKLEKEILSKGRNITSVDLAKYETVLNNQEKLSKAQKRVKREDFDRKVKRAIQLPNQ